MGQALDAGIPRLGCDLVQIPAAVHIAVREHNLGGHGRGGEDIGEQGVGIEGNGPEQLVQRVGREQFAHSLIGRRDRVRARAGNAAQRKMTAAA
jgi:hypothetical protein